MYDRPHQQGRHSFAHPAAHSWMRENWACCTYSGSNIYPTIGSPHSDGSTAHDYALGYAYVHPTDASE
jgi:hypothetical protein